ncbi:alpha-mannosidase 2 [Trichogramma pretiosum]|nr:alpha-mannosidase 2 [Trichogramma pretiosum]XP_014227201.1 alpha-mannosidase 2 [Trichogramma pretiosum]XP_014227202.1 alpha-mannosidase 2 [Trichogramma pretiosum]
MYKLLRRGSGRMLVLCAVLLSVLLCLYYVSQTQSPNGAANAPASAAAAALLADAGLDRVFTSAQPEYNEAADAQVSSDTCPLITPREADIDVQAEYDKFEFQPSWMRSREYWDDSFEQRYSEYKKDSRRPPLKVILVPHSHTDPGWLKTFEQYFHSSTRSILNNMVTKLQQWPNMTFIWSEVSFLSLWWESAHPTKKMIVKRLIKEGRLEMTTGGWVMTDEATTHIYAMLDQLIEGHQWLKTNLDVTPEYGWSVDVFGHGSTVPYLLKASGVGGTVIQRLHYAWKQWFAKKQYGDFVWVQPWDQNGVADLLTHNQPFDIYNIKHSCGPHPHVCLNYDFRKIRNEYTEYSVKAVDISSSNVKALAEQLLEQYFKTGSLFPHNVVLIPLGDDFRYDHPVEWDQQYTNYKILIDFINNRKEEYNAEVVFGTVRDYFQEIEKRMARFPTLKGDFFVYSDIFSEGRPAYWSGYFTTRPYLKILDRELEANLRSAEILYTVALNVAKQSARDIKLYETYFEKLVKARRNLGLFQHHDAITGTSKASVMKDYALKLFESISDMTSLQSFTIQSLAATELKNASSGQIYVLSESDRDSYEKLPKKIPISINNKETKRIVLFNSLAQPRQEVVSLKVSTHRVRVLDSQKNPIPYQIAPQMNATSITHDVYVLLFVAELKPLSIQVYHLQQIDKVPPEAISTVYCTRCGKDQVFPIKPMQVGDVQLENQRMKLLFDGQTGFLKRVTKKPSGKIIQCNIQFAAYPSAQFHSGAYLFMPDPNLRDSDKDVLEAYTPHQKIYIVSGALSSRLTVEYGKLLAHHVALYHKEGPLSEAIHLRSVVDFEAPPKNRETEMFMRIQTDIVNGEPPVFYSDENGHQMIKRTKIERIGIEGNYYPITSMAYIEDQAQRLTLLVNHAHGASSYQPGWLEVMLDRRTLYDDARGMGEGLLDNRKTVMKHWLLLEDVVGDQDRLSKPSLFANHMSNALNYPANLFVVDSPESEIKLQPETRLLSHSLPCDVHMLNLRTNHDPKMSQYPINNALMVLHRQGFSCTVGADIPIKHCPLSDRPAGDTRFLRLSEPNITKTSLTGTKVEKWLKAGFRDIAMQPMEIQTYNVNFAVNLH